MLIDIIVCVLMLVALFKGLKNGLVLALLSFLGVVIGLAAAMKLSTLAADYLGKNISISARWLPVLAFMAVFIVVVFLVRIGARLLESFFRVATLNWLNRLGGVILYMLLYLFMISILLFYSEQVGLVKPGAGRASLTYPFIHGVAPFMLDGLGIVLPFFRDMFSELELFFEGVASQQRS